MRLAIDTSGQIMSAALAESGRVIATRTSAAEGRIAEGIDLLVAEVLAEAGKTVQDISEIVVGLGPGSFTGVRTGVAAALGMATGLDVPIFGANVLLAAAFSAASNDATAVYRTASGSENFVAVYNRAGELIEPQAISTADFRQQVIALLGETPNFLQISDDINIADLLTRLETDQLTSVLDPVYIKPVNARTLAERRLTGK